MQNFDLLNIPPTFHVGNIPIYGESILSPMDGVSDWPFRSLCRELGSAMSYSEFVRAEKIVHSFERVRAKFRFDETERPVVFQISGDDPQSLLEAALRLQELKPDIIDINMGCPMRKVANQGAGAGLMRTPLKVARIFKMLSSALEVSVTGKIRIGWNDCRNYGLIARIIEENGGALVAIHGRTKEQRYSGHADWDAIAEVRSAVKIPVIGNGDVKTVADIERMKEYTGCEAVMIGRAAIMNPWIFSSLDREQVPQEQVRQFVQEHLARNIQFYGPVTGQRLFRKHVVQYLLLKKLSREERRVLLSESPAEEFLDILNEVSAAIL